MSDFHVLLWALSLLFCMAMGFVILLWCRSWRREEREAAERHIEAMSREVSRLAVAVDGMEETAASLQAADEQLANDVGRLREQVRLLRSASSAGNRTIVDRTPAPVQHPSRPAAVSQEEPDPPRQVAEAAPDPQAGEPEPSHDRFEDARRLLRQGTSELDVARQLQMGAAEVRMIARMLDRAEAS